MESHLTVTHMTALPTFALTKDGSQEWLKRERVLYMAPPKDFISLP